MQGGSAEEIRGRAVRMRQLELDANVRLPASLPVTLSTSSDVVFDVSKPISLVSVFRESEVEYYFRAFERKKMRWPFDAVQIDRQSSGGLFLSFLGRWPCL